ncbi:hypothetical protein ACVWXO_002971 [Bradyrhizobium sp. LM2.7]
MTARMVFFATTAISLAESPPHPDCIFDASRPLAAGGERRRNTYTLGMLIGRTSRACAASLIPAFAAPKP